MIHRYFYSSVKGANLCYCPIKTIIILSSGKQARVRELYLKLKGFLGGSYSQRDVNKETHFREFQKKAPSITLMTGTMKRICLVKNVENTSEASRGLITLANDLHPVYIQFGGQH